jgi:RecA-family ATPase
MNKDFIGTDDTVTEEILAPNGGGAKGGGKRDKPLPFIDMSTWDNVPAPPRHWLVHDRIPRRQPTILSGHGEAGKSTLLLQLLAATALGRDWIGLLPEPGPTIYLGAEEEEEELHRRLDPILQHYDARYADLIDRGLKLMSYAGKDMVLGIVDKQGRVKATELFRWLYREACSLQPKLIAIDGLSDIYVGNERERGQVRQFMGLFRRLGIDADGAVVIAAHPSLTGIREGSGMSGSTQWYNSVRAQMYLKLPDEDDEDADDQADNDLRELQFLKNQYGRKGHAIRLHWQNGLYLPVQSQGTLDALAAERKADDLFLKLLRRFADEGRNVTDKKGTSFAPAIFADEPEAKKAKVTNKALADAMRRLFAANKIRVVTEGPASKQRTRIVEVGDQEAGASTNQKPGQNQNNLDGGSQELTCAVTTDLSATSTNPSTNVPPSSTNVPPLPPNTPRDGGRGKDGGSHQPLATIGEDRKETRQEEGEEAITDDERRQLPAQAPKEAPKKKVSYRIIDDCEDSTVCVKCGQPGGVKRIKDSTRPGSQSETLHEGCAAAWFE